ncbi:hypothetical protein [Phytohabitans houttuyneae]|uniref:hypothetical protein n=1 Tax=Phytohabitans houttuyneae TaxID=1076126 RepID=UPI0031E73590
MAVSSVGEGEGVGDCETACAAGGHRSGVACSCREESPSDVANRAIGTLASAAAASATSGHRHRGARPGSSAGASGGTSAIAGISAGSCWVGTSRARNSAVSSLPASPTPRLTVHYGMIEVGRGPLA